MTLMEQLLENSQKDSRKNFADFYNTFDLDKVFSKPMANFVLNGKREPKNAPVIMSFLSKCISIYRENTKDYVHYQEKTSELYENYNLTHEVGIIPERLQTSTGRELLAIKRAISDDEKGINAKATNDVRDALKFDLISTQRSLDELFNNVTAYRELERRLMRAQIGDGTTIKTIYDISQESGLDSDLLENLSKACHHKEDFENTYQKLVNLQQVYNLD